VTGVVPVPRLDSFPAHFHPVVACRAAGAGASRAAVVLPLAVVVHTRRAGAWCVGRAPAWLWPGARPGPGH
jgi:hypothetical protein